MTANLQLRDDAIIKTVAALNRRISDRFPQSGLSDLCGRLLSVAEQSAVRAHGIGQSVWWIRICGYLLAAGVIGSVGGMIWIVAHSVRLKDEAISWPDLIGTVDAGTSVLIVFGATIYFLISLEIRIKRRRAMNAVHELRSIAHVVDMHQLTKDPERMRFRYKQTNHSPTEVMTPTELNRYLDYCTEMLSLIGKIAALYVQRFDDPAAVAAVSEVEQLTTGLSRKIWQKIMLLSQLAERQTNLVAPSHPHGDSRIESSPPPSPPFGDSITAAESAPPAEPAPVASERSDATREASENPHSTEGT